MTRTEQNFVQGKIPGTALIRKLLLFAGVWLMCCQGVISGQGHCIDGFQGECSCYTTPILCTVDELEGYTFTMSDFQHPLDAPHPLCIQDGWGVPNNPTWFAFVAWCNQLTITFKVLGCDPLGGNLQGIQVAVYTGCGDAAHPVACDTAPEDCGDADNKTIDMNLTIGQVYYLLLDGCSGGSCTIEIDVWGVCGEAFLGDWEFPIIGPEEVCTGESASYTVEPIDGANYYHWYIDGVLVEEDKNLTSFSHIWNTPGTFELCVDGSSAECVPVSEDPDPLCKTITVYQPEAGTIEVSPSPACPGENAVISASGYKEESGYENFIVVVDTQNTVVRVTQSSTTIFAFQGCGMFTAYSFNYYDSGENFPPSIGNTFDPSACSCCDSDGVVFEVTDTVAPELLNPPADVTLSCFDQLQPITSIDWVDNCGAASEVKTQGGFADLCNGGLLVRHWSVTDRCDNEVTHVQMITVSPTPIPAFIAPPPDTVMSCVDVPAAFPPLDYRNGISGGCSIEGSVAPVVERSFNACGGSITLLYEYTDTCGRTISHTRNIAVEPAPPADWVSTPGDTTVDCGVWPGIIPDLLYTNGISGICGNSGPVPGVQTAYDVCTGIATWEWEYTDACGNTITHARNIYTDPLPALTFMNAPSDITITCEQAPAENTAPPLDYSNNGSGACFFAGSVDGVQSGSWDPCGGQLERAWTVQDPCGRQFVHQQTVTVLPATIPGFVSLPGDITVTCDAVPGPEYLYVSNGISQGPCAIYDSVLAVMSGAYDACGGALSYRWEWTGICGIALTYTQNVTVLEAEPPVFDAVSIPAFLASDEIETVSLDLNYSNGLSGSCSVIGTTTAELVSTFNPCGGTATFTWSATDLCGNMITQEHIASILPSPVTIDAGPDALLDCATPNVLLTAVTSHPDETSWIDPEGAVTDSETIVATQPGQYIAIVSFADTCVFSDTVVVLSDPTLPEVDAGPDQVLNCEVREVLLESEILIGSANVTYEWTNADGEVIGSMISAPVTAPGIYYVRIYDADADCWSEKDAVEVTDISNDPSAIIYADPGNILSCRIEFIVMSSDKQNNVEYTWLSNGQAIMDSSLLITMPGTITLIAVDTITRCESIDSMIVNSLDEYPVIYIVPPDPISCASPTVTLDASNSIPGPPVGMYTWTNLAGDTLGSSTTLQVDIPGDYILTIVDPTNDCTSDDTITVEDISVFPEIVDAPDVILGCDQSGGMLEVMLANPVPGSETRWQTIGGQITGSATEAEIEFSGPGMYVVEILHLPSQCFDRDTIVVTQVSEVPEAIALTSTPSSCLSVHDGMLTLGPIQGGTPPYVIYVNSIETTETIFEGLPAGEYLIEVEDAYGCILEEIVIVPAGDEVMVDLVPSVHIKEGDSILLEATVNIPPEEILTIQWTPSDSLNCDTCLSTYADPIRTTPYTIVVTDVFGCTGMATVIVRVARETRIFIPNVLSPNNDHINDLLTVYSNNPETRVLSLEVFDRWGALIYQRTDFAPNHPQGGWDGTYRGQLVGPGVFVYKAEVEEQPGVVKILAGDVTVVR